MVAAEDLFLHGEGALLCFQGWVKSTFAHVEAGQLGQDFATN